jgi:acyl carrier protein
LSTTILEQLRSLASDLFSLPVNSVTEISSPESIENWDSMQHLNLVLAVEEQFNIQLSPEEIEQMRSVGQIAQIVEQKLQTTRE